MTWVISPALEAALRQAAAAELAPTSLAPTRLHAAVVDRSLRYTSDRAALTKGRDSDDDLAARAVFFSVADAAKLWPALAELARVMPLLSQPALSAIDLGAGCGAMSLGLIAAAAQAGCASLQLYLADVDPRALRIAKAACLQFAASCGLACSVTTSPVDFAKSGGAVPRDWPQADLVLMGSVLNELAGQAAQGLAAHAIGRCKPAGAVIIIEPALRMTSRALHELRGWLVAEKHVAVVAPCTHQAPCPMLADENDWCHQERPYALPPLAEDIARVTGLRDGAMKFSYLIVTPDAAAVASLADLVRVVSRPQASKGKIEMDGCGAQGLVTLRRLNRHRSDANRGFDRAGRGDLLRLGPDVEMSPPAAAIREEAAVERLPNAALAALMSLILALGAMACQTQDGAPSQSAAAAAAAAATQSSAAPAALEPAHLSRFAPLPTAPEQPAALVALGRKLFFETALSQSKSISCASCHPLHEFGMDGLRLARGHKGQEGTRNTPTVFNAAYQSVLFWDGRAGSVEMQAKMPVLSAVEMAMPSEAAVVAVLAALDPYPALFRAAFPASDEPLTYEHVAAAIGAFEKTLLTPGRWDAFLRGDASALSAEEQQGARLFVETGCTQCHLGALVGGHIFQKLGRMEPWPNLTDRGRFHVTGAKADDYVFKVPSLRNVAKTAPYLHDGSVATLEEQVRLMAKHQLGKQLTPQDAKRIATFLGALTGDVAP